MLASTPQHSISQPSSSRPVKDGDIRLVDFHDECANWLSRATAKGDGTTKAGRRSNDRYLMEIAHPIDPKKQSFRSERDAFTTAYHEDKCHEKGRSVPVGIPTKAERIKQALNAMNEASLLHTKRKNDVDFSRAYIAIRDMPYRPSVLLQRMKNSEWLDDLLPFASMLGSASTVNKLLADGASLTAVDLLGNTALHWAYLVGAKDVVRCLEHWGARSDGPKNRFFGTPLDYAQTFGPEIPCVAMVEQNGVEIAMSASQVEKHLGFLPVQQSIFTIDAIVNLAAASFLEEIAERVISALPPLPLADVKAPLLALKSYDDIGWGVRSRQLAPKGAYVGSYTADIICKSESNFRAAGLEFGLNLFETTEKKALDEILAWQLDAAFRGCIVSRINSGGFGQGNVSSIEGFRRGRPVRDFYATRAIPAGEQLAWYYGRAYWKTAGIKPVTLSIDHDYFSMDDSKEASEEEQRRADTLVELYRKLRS